MATITPEMADKFEAILKRVKEPETELSVSELNLVKRISYSETEKKFLIFMDIATPKFPCLTCGVVTEQIRSTIERRLREEFMKEFPGYEVETV
ncbi:MAG TPA: hypothetical protein PLB48_00505 [Treponema sp.]|jgi:metal-sulfur cluster biosynthetic enzyme|uniref:MIP18 family-like domain-containing protein n=1 Tax=Gracilinema caldarium TaxID=215591 RepID=A0A7C3II40_9SPIR|nr:hypothetical protein [Gracilinema caldarium]NLJ09974.1 hypothetical protein [Treponema sp.]HON12562.1 hypothetical protein [Treponema sp.]HPC70263.1 hypothetical protein [Treponema sp.]HRS02906.1 hypothetical protein [Treponema sp.]HRU27480.1 hypothetical protein [Treponema sp.]